MMKTVNYIIAGIFAAMALCCMIGVFLGAYHQAILFVISSFMAFVLYCEAKDDGQ